MSRRILWINPVGTSAYNEPIGSALRDEALPDTRIDVVSRRGDRMLLRPIPPRRPRDFRPNGRYGPAEACLHIASTLGERASILVGRSKWIPEMHENVEKYGFAGRSAGFRILRMTVNEFQADPACTENRILTEARKAVEEDGADVIILGCTIEFGFYRKVQEELGVPVVDAIVAPLRYAEFLADLDSRHGWRTSRALGYGRRAEDELNAFIPVIEPVISLDPRG